MSVTAPQPTDRVHLRFQIDVPPLISAKERGEKVEELAKLLVTLRDIARGRPTVDWDKLIDPKAPAETAAEIAQILHRHPAHVASSVAAVSARMTTPAHLSIIAKLDEPFRTRIRDDVLQHVLKGLTTSGDTPMPVCADLMVEMIRLELVLIRGVATTLDTLLRDRSTRRAAMAVIGRLAELYRTTQHDGLLQTVNHVQPTLQLAQGDPNYDYDLNAIYRFMQWQPTPQASLVWCRSIATPHKQISCSAYFNGRDELATGGVERTVAVWGAPGYGDSSPSASFQLAPSSIPVAMDSNARGNLLAVACVSSGLKGNGAPSAPGGASGAGGPATGASATVSGIGSNVTSHIQPYVCSDTGTWTVGEPIRRPEKTIITCIKCLASRGSVMCSAETVDEAAHQLVFFNAAGTESRRFSRAHADCITALATSAENDHLLLSGSRDLTVKLWDARASSSSSSVAVLEGHGDTITSVAAVRDFLLTSSYDGKLRLWDTRRLKTEVSSKSFSAPVLKVCPTLNATSVVSTLQGLYLLSLFPAIRVEDVLANVSYHDLRANHDGSVVFASRTTVDVYAVQWAGAAVPQKVQPTPTADARDK